MRAIAISGYGQEPELMELPKPTPGPNGVLVRVHAAGLNPVDWKIAEGEFKTPGPFPKVLGIDGAGVVEAVGPAVTAFRPGDQVYGQLKGSYAEYALATSVLARMPAGMIFTQAAAIPVATTTAYNMVETAKIDQGKVVLVSGATGGVGQQAVQFAANAGAKVIATATADMAEHMRGLGAAELVDHTLRPVAEQVLQLHPDGIDAVLDTVSTDPAALDQLAQTVRPGGTVVTTVFSADPAALAAREITGVNLDNKAGAELLVLLADLIDAGRIKVRIDDVVPLSAAATALANNKAGRSRGKTVIEIQPR
ncbi:NADP-dependent oxidoreductase [Nonomuraea endophytica]|uniref:NADPH:quinone reductase-like Zn-dependent oxidoreductase n=1 Tax=Nonomuraea endophytica TaxID=714136 RepID=A0A7W7ZYI5_9ACTN|nr:NADP-dependent oxidoreductase [Nonomuraea endophytica]MBB5076139.1 NADPH:quinone reductase-like Zn-dependent oxidoreductase [Nonomuraea endophytica]